MLLEGPDQLQLQAAHGYVELGLFEEANAELEEIDCSTDICTGINLRKAHKQSLSRLVESKR